MRSLSKRVRGIRKFRKARDDAYYFNWRLFVPPPLQRRFEPTHQSMAALDLTRDQSVSEMTFNLRRAFSGVVAGNIKEYGIAQIEASGPFQLRGIPLSLSSWMNCSNLLSLMGGCGCRVETIPRVMRWSPLAHPRQVAAPVIKVPRLFFLKVV